MRGWIGRQAWRGAGMRLACLTLLVATAPQLSGQETSAASGSTQPVQRDYRFEVASIRPGTPPTGLEYKAGPSGYSPGRFRETNASLSTLVYLAFGIHQHFEMDCPHWMDSAYFTLNATLPEGATKADVPMMLKHFLEDRFGLVFHREVKQMAGYELTVAKSGVKLTKPEPPAQEKLTSSGPAVEVKNGLPQFTKDAPSGQLLTLTRAVWRGRDETLEKLASNLANTLHAPVVDTTGLEGKYNYDLVFTPESNGNAGSAVMMGAPPPGGGSGTVVGDDVPAQLPFLRDALQEQLGLKLQPVKSVPVNVVVVDSAKREPTEN